MLLVVPYHLPKRIRKSRMECKWKDFLQFCLRERKFSRQNGISREEDHNSQTEFSNGKFACLYRLVPGLLGWIAFGSIFREKVVEMEQAHLPENFHLGFDAPHSLQLSTNQFSRVNGKRPLLSRKPRKSMAASKSSSIASSQLSETRDTPS